MSAASNRASTWSRDSARTRSRCAFSAVVAVLARAGEGGLGPLQRPRDLPGAGPRAALPSRKQSERRFRHEVVEEDRDLALSALGFRLSGLVGAG